MTNHRTPVAPSTISLRVVLLDHHRVLRLGAALILLNACLAGWSQSIWQPRPVPRCPGMQRLLVDTLSDRIYFYGVNGLPVNEPCGPFGGDVYAWDHYQWDSITYIAGTPRAMIVYHDTLIMGGGFADFEENGTVAYGPVFLSAELETAYIAEWIQRLASTGLRSVEVRADVSHEWSDAIQAELSTMSWTGNCPNFYRDRSGRIVSFFPGTIGRMRRELNAIDDEPFVLDY